MHAQLLRRDKLRAMSPIELEAALRSVVLKLQYTEAILQDLPAGARRVHGFACPISAHDCPNASKLRW